MTQQTIPFSLTKATEQVVFNLTKRGITDVPKDINVSLLLDYSSSMETEYNSGAVTNVLRRLLSISNTIDDDGNMELVVFHHDAMHYGTLNVGQYDQAQDIITDVRRQYRMGGTCFAPAVRKTLEVLGTSKETVVEKASGFLGKLFGSTTTKEVVKVSEVEGKQLLVLISDGSNGDSADFRQVVRQIEQMPNIYLQCLAVGYDSSYLRAIADESDSVGYSSLTDFTQTDDALIESIINKELLDKFAAL